MRFISFIAVLLIFFLPEGIFASSYDSGSICSGDIFVNVNSTARARASGFSFLALSDDASALFYNPSGLPTIRIGTLYFDYGICAQEPSSNESRGAFIFPFEDFSFGAGFYRKNSDSSVDENVLILGAGYRLTQGTEGSFLSIGANVRVNSLLLEDPDGCEICPFNGSDTGVSGDAGIMVRPLPMVSISYLLDNINERQYETGLEPVVYRRSSRWGMSVFWKDTLVISWERYGRKGTDCDNFGFIMRSSVPLEMMAGFYREKVTGGLRWTGRRFNIGLSFSPLEDSGIYTAVALEFFLETKDREK